MNASLRSRCGVHYAVEKVCQGVIFMDTGTIEVLQLILL